MSACELASEANAIDKALAMAKRWNETELVAGLEADLATVSGLLGAKLATW